MKNKLKIGDEIKVVDIEKSPEWLNKKVKIILDAMSNTIPKALFAALLRQGIDANGNQNLEIRLYNKFNIINGSLFHFL